MHLTELPRWKGAASISWKILCGERRGGTTIHELTTKIDEGRIIHQRNNKIPRKAEKPDEIYKYTIMQAEKTVFHMLDKLAKGSVERKGEQTNQGFYFPRLITEQNAAIDWSWSNDEIYRFIRAFDKPYPGAWTRLDGENKITLKDCKIKEMDIGSHPFNAGLIIAKNIDRYVIATRDGFIEANLNEGKRLVGRRLITKAEDLEKARYIPKIKP